MRNLASLMQIRISELLLLLKVEGCFVRGANSALEWVLRILAYQDFGIQEKSISVFWHIRKLASKDFMINTFSKFF